MSTVSYDPQVFEPKWQAVWEKLGLFQHSEKQSGVTATNKEYLLFAFAYPSGSGLHVGHVESKTALDMLARFKRMNGKKIFFPVGWDAFGLPAENYAIKTGIPPAKTTKDAINTFRTQIKRLAISYDWANEIATSHPGYYHWTQWIFLQLYKKGLAYRGIGLVNWCPSCQTVLANEQVVNGKCERCGTQVIQKELEQWYFKITKYAEELISGLDKVDWPNATKQQQLHWIGKSSGARVSFQAAFDDKPSNKLLEVYTTAHDTIFGCTFMVISPEHEFLKQQKKRIKNLAEVEAYLKKASKKSELDRQIQKEKTGVLVEGIEFINPVNQERVPLYVADYVLAHYGTGAIMAVPAHDSRDHEFAKKYNLPIISVTTDKQLPDYSEIKANPRNFVLENSGEFNGLDFIEGRAKILDKLEKLNVGRAEDQYKLRDWLISRQRYWGAPIPIVYDPQGKPHPVKEEHLPWMLPEDVDFKPTGESPLKSSKEFFARTEKLYGKGWTPECDTMDTFVDSSWYFMRYVDSRDTKVFADPSQLKKWLPVDLYLIGPEHIVLHLLYSRFFTKFLRDEGYLKFDEPFLKMRHQGMILGPDGKKMSKSKGNVINPDSVIEKYGADTLRVYEMFMGPLESDKPWDTGSVIGIYRLLQRIHTLVDLELAEERSGSDPSLHRHLHRLVKKIGEDLPALKFNTAIAAIMIFINDWEAVGKKKQGLDLVDTRDLIKTIAPFAPFLSEELYHRLPKKIAKDGFDSVHQETWPKFDPQLAQPIQMAIVVQVNGKLRGQLEVGDQARTQKELEKMAKELNTVSKWLANQEIVKTIFVPGKLINFVIKAA